MFRTLLFCLLQSLLVGLISSVSQIKNIVSPKLDYSNNQIGTMSFTFFWRTDFEYNEPRMLDLQLRVVFPVPLTAPLKISWIKVGDACIVSTNLRTTISSPSTIPGDLPGAHFFKMEGADYQPGSRYKIIFKIDTTVDIPTTPGMTNPISFAVVSSTEPKFLTYAINSSFGTFFITPTAPGDFEFDLTPSYSDPNIQTFTRDFYGSADVRIQSDPTSTSLARILLKLDNYVFSDDAESTCTTFPDTTKNIKALDRNDFYCEFEDIDKKGLFVVWKDGKYVPTDTTFRLRFRIKNPNLPGSASLKIAMMERYSPRLLKFKEITGGFSCGAADFGIGYPRLYIGPNLDTSSDLFPGVSLFTMMDNPNTIVFNSVKLEFKISTDLPQPSDSYKILIKIGGTVNTLIPKTFIYHDLPLAAGRKIVKVEVDPTTRDITFTNVGSASSRASYTIGFKVALFGDETLSFFGTDTFASMEIFDASNTVVISRQAPQGVKSSFKKVITNIWDVEAGDDTPTLFHTLKQSQTATTDFSGINDNWNKYGLEKGTQLQFILKALFRYDGGAARPFSPVVEQSYIEIITSSTISQTKLAADYSDANSDVNCQLRHSGETVDNSRLAGCLYESRNKGVVGSEYSRFRMKSKTSSFFAGGSTWYRYYNWLNVDVTKSNSMFFSDTDATVLDTYLNVYEDTYTKDITATFPIGLKFQYLDNMILRLDDQFTTTTLDLLNYQSSNNGNQYAVLDPLMMPGLLRIGGKFENIDTFETSKIVIFFYEFEPLVKDIENPYEVGCSTSSTATVRCYYIKGEEDALCRTPSTKCRNPLMYSRIEVLFSSTIISVADTTQVQVTIPILVPKNMPGTINAAIASAKGHTGTLSAYPQILTYKIMDIKRPQTSNSYTTPLNSGQVNDDNRQYNMRLVTSNNRVGATFDSQFNLFAQGGRTSIAVATDQYYGFTFCSTYNFMQSQTFDVPATGNAYKLCVKNIYYQFQNPSTLLTEERYCLFCPLWETGTDSTTMSVSSFFVSPAYGLNWPVGTYAAMTGRATRYGLLSIVDHTLVLNSGVNTKWSNNFIDQISVTPSSINFDDTQGTTSEKSIKIIFAFRTANPVPAGATFVFSAFGSQNLPFEFKNNPSTFCYLANSITTQPCSIIPTPHTSFQFVVGTAMAKGPMTLTIYGIQSRKGTVTLPFTFKINISTYIPGGTGNLNLIDIQDIPAEIQMTQYQEEAADAKLNVLTLSEVRLLETNPGVQTELEIDVKLGNSKNFYENDKLWINLNDGAYVTNAVAPAKPVYCKIIDTVSRKLITSFKTCNTDNLGNIEIDSSKDTFHNAFTVRITSYINPTTLTTALTGQLRFIDDNGFLQQELEAGSEPSWPTQAATSSVFAFTIAKTVSFIGLRTQIAVTFQTQISAIKYESRVYLKFPFEYDPQLGSFPVSCYLNKGASLEKLYCWMFTTRTLAISGFRTEFSAQQTVKVEIFGVEQPEIVNAENFYFGFDNDDDPSTLDETGFFSLTTLAQPVGATIQLVEVVHSEYSHKYIRSKNSYLFVMRSPIDILPGSFIYVYIDYLDFEHDKVPELGECIVQETPTSTSIASGCQREGNRYKITLSAQYDMNKSYTVLIKNIPTPDFAICNVKKPSIYVTDSAFTLLLISTDFFQNSPLTSYSYEPSQIYLTFRGLNADSPIKMIKGVYNEILVQREDLDRFNDDFNFELLDTENGIFAQFDSSKVIEHDSMIGLENYPIFISSTLNSFNNIIPVSIGNTPRFQVQLFANLPSLRVELTSNKAVLKLPELVVFTSKGSLPFYVELDQIPITATPFTVTFEGTTLLTATPATFTLSETVKRFKISISSSHPAGVSVETPSIVITPTGASGYGVTKKVITLKAVPAPPAGVTESKVVEQSTQTYGITVDYSGPSPASFYYIAMPQDLYRKFGKEYIVTKYNTNQMSDSFYYIGYGLAAGTSVLNIPLLQGKLTSSKYFKFLFYFTDLDNKETEYSLVSQTKDSPGGYGYFNLTFASSIEKEKLPDLVCKLAQMLSYPLENLQTSDGHRCQSNYTTEVLDGVEMDPTVVTTVLSSPPVYPANPNVKPFTSNFANGFQIDSAVFSNITSGSLGGTTTSSTTRRALQVKVIDKTPGRESNTTETSTNSTSVVQIYTLKNLKPEHDTTAYSKIQSIIINQGFYSQLGDKLKDYPQVINRTPLISLQFFPQKLERDTKIYRLKGDLTVQLTEMKAKNAGYIFCMILPKNQQMGSLLIKDHIVRGIDAKNATATWKKKIDVKDPATIHYFNIEELPFPTNSSTISEFTFYYLATDERVSSWSEQSEIKTIDFRITRVLDNGVGLFMAWIVVFVGFFLF